MTHDNSTLNTLMDAAEGLAGECDLTIAFSSCPSDPGGSSRDAHTVTLSWESEEASLSATARYRGYALRMLVDALEADPSRRGWVE